MNVELLLNVKAAILANPQHFDVAFFCAKEHCGTTACIGGWTVAVSACEGSIDKLYKYYTSGGVSLEEEARGLLGLDWRQAEELFYASCDDDRCATAEGAAHYIDDFIAKYA